MPDISYSIGLCSQNGPFLTSYIKPIAEKYRFSFRSLSTLVSFVTSPGLGAPGNEPSSGTFSDSDLAGENWAEPNMYGMKE